MNRLELKREFQTGWSLILNSGQLSHAEKSLRLHRLNNHYRKKLAELERSKPMAEPRTKDTSFTLPEGRYEESPSRDAADYELKPVPNSSPVGGHEEQAPKAQEEE